MADKTDEALRKGLSKIKLGELEDGTPAGLELEEIEQIMTLVRSHTTKAVADAQTNAVAWTIGVLDELHLSSDSFNARTTPDRLYKGAKSTIRDRYKAEAGVDPAPSYPLKAKLAQLQEESKS